jgi:uracil-DNA glycosylase
VSRGRELESARVGKLRGSVLEVAEVGVPVVVTLHPSAVLRAGVRRAERRAELVDDLTLVREHIAR